jgi:hypothetical protein
MAGLKELEVEESKVHALYLDGAMSLHRALDRIKTLCF